MLRSDAAKLSDIDALHDAIAKKLGSLDAVFINAGQAKLTLHEQVSEADYDRQFGINTKGPYFTIARLAPLVNRGGGAPNALPETLINGELALRCLGSLARRNSAACAQRSFPMRTHAGRRWCRASRCTARAV